MAEDFSELEAVFREEVTDLAEKMSDAIERLPRLGDEQFAAELRTVSRMAHNLKGAAASVGDETIEAIAHAIEDVLAPAKESRVALAGDGCGAMLRALSAIARFGTGEAGRGELDPALEALRPMPRAVPGETPQRAQPAANPHDMPAEDGSSGIRVDTRRLDRLMGFAGELLISQARQASRHQQLGEFARSLSGTPEESGARETLRRRFEPLLRQDARELAAFSHLTRELHDAMKQLRMMPLTGLGTTWRRVVRDAAQQLGREARLVCEFGDLELDKAVLDGLRDPMMHILRNAVAHGLEPPEERVARGKPREGRILVRAEARGIMISLEISDDGRGLDLVRIREAAVTKGLLTKDAAAALSPRDITELIFHPEFSTAAVVTRQSGRGVGLDVVRSRVARLGGHVEVDPHGRLGGATFRLWTPASVVSTVGFFARCGETTFALPVEYVQRTVRRMKHELQRVEGRPVLVLDDEEPVRLEAFEALLGLPQVASGTDRKVVVLAHGGSRLGIEVDEVVGQREYVVQPLPWNLTGLPGVNGAIIQPDGSLAVPIDVRFLFEAARRVSAEAPAAADTRERRERRILVVDDSASARTLEEGMLSSGGYLVQLAVDGEEAWQRLEKEAFDLVVADVQMPKLDGIELTRRIRKSARHHDLPVVLVTQLAQQRDREAGAAAGADAYFVKGKFTARELLDTVASFL